MVLNNLQADKISSNTGNSLIINSDGNISLNTPSASKVITTNIEADQLASATGRDLSISGRKNLNRIANTDMYILATSGLTTLNSVGLILQANNMNIGKVGCNYTLCIISDQVSLDARNSLFLGLDYNSGKVVIGNQGIQFGTLGNALLNAYEENRTFSNMSTTVTSFTFRFVKIGKSITVTLANRTAKSAITSTSGATFSQVIGSKYCSSNDINLPMMGWGVANDLVLMRVLITTPGTLTIACQPDIFSLFIPFF